MNADMPAAIDELAALGRRFVGWRLTSDGRKMPIDPATGRAASSTDASTWSDLGEAQQAVDRDHLTGLGFVLDAARDGVVGIDLDGCRDPETGKIATWAHRIISNIRSYAEVSPSGTGVKIIARADQVPVLAANKRTMGPANGHKAPAVEIYLTGRYFALTGQILNDVPDEITEATPAIEKLVRWVANGAPKPKAELPAAFLALLDKDGRLREAWEKGTKLGTGGDTTASALDFSLARYLRPHLDDAVLDAVLRLYPHGQIGSGKIIKGKVADRRIEGILREIGPRPQKQAEPALSIVWAKDIALEIDSADVIEGFMPRAGLGVGYGQSGSGKTFVAIDIACHGAAGLPWRGMAVEQGAVVYIAAESPASVRRRIWAWREHCHPDNLPLVVVQSSVDLLNGSTDQVVELVGRVREEHGRVAMVVVDTLARSMVGNENASDDMSAFVSACGRIQQAGDTFVLVVHHSGKNELLGARGHSSLRAATDLELEITNGDDGGCIRVTKSRDDASGRSYGFKLDTFELGTNAKGRMITTCIVRPTDPPPPKAPPRPALGSVQRILVGELRKLAKRNPGGVEEDTLRSAFVAALHAQRQREGKPTLEAKRFTARFVEALSSLLASGLVDRLEDDLLVPQP